MFTRLHVIVVRLNSIWTSKWRSFILVQHMKNAVLDGECSHPMVHRLPQPSHDLKGMLALLDDCGVQSYITNVEGGNYNV